MEDSDFNRAYPAHYGASIEIAGQVWTAHDALGDPEVPMTEAQVREKAAMLMEYGGIVDPDGLIKAALQGDYRQLCAQLT